MVANNLNQPSANVGGDIELGQMNNPQRAEHNSGIGAQVGAVPQSHLAANLSSVARAFLGAGAENRASALAADTMNPGSNERATVTSTTVGQILAKKTLIAGGLALFAVGAGIGGAIGARVGRSNRDAIQAPIVPKPSCPVFSGNLPLRPTFVGSYDVNLLGKAGFTTTKQALIKAGKALDQYADPDGQLQHDVYKTHIWNSQQSDDTLYANFYGKPSLSKPDFLGQVLTYNLHDDIKTIAKEDLLVRINAVWDNADISLDTLVDAQQWAKMVSQQDWGSFKDVQVSAAVFHAEQHWGALPEKIDQSTWDAKGFEAAGYGSESPTYRHFFLDNVRKSGPFSDAMSRKEIEYFAVNDSMASKRMADIGLSKTGFNLIDFRTEGELFDQPFEAYSSNDASNNYDSDSDFISANELANAITEHFSTAASTPSRQLN